MSPQDEDVDDERDEAADEVLEQSRAVEGNPLVDESGEPVVNEDDKLLAAWLFADIIGIGTP